MLNGTRRAFWILSLSVFVFMSSGCTNVYKRTVTAELDRDNTNILKDKGQRIVGYSRSDGSYHEFKGYVAIAGPDSLSFLKPGDTDDYWGNPNKFVNVETIHRNDVMELNVAESSGVVEGLLVGCLVILVIAAVALATKESCPFIYSYDGEKYTFDGEPYGGATMSSLQRTDYSELEHLRAVDGQYRLMLTNEVDETQHTDSLNLVVVDHPRQTTPVMDMTGQVHCFENLTGLVAAHDEDGTDLLPLLREKDLSNWNPDLERFAAMDSLPDTRNHITLEFPRPAGADSLYLVTNVGTGQWGSHMIRVMLGMRGNSVDEFYTAINQSPEYQRQLRAWNEREELFLLGVEVQVDDHWETRTALHGGGPFVMESRALPLDLSGVTGETIRFRVNPPIGFWRFNSFHLAWDEKPAAVSMPNLVSAVDGEGRDVASTIIAEDQVYLDFPTTGEYAEIIFAAPAPQPGLDRTVFAVTSGWYGIHLYNDGPADDAGLARLTFEPGYAVRRAMAELRVFNNTGVLNYINQELVTP